MNSSEVMPKINTTTILDTTGQLWQLSPTKAVGVWEARKIYAPNEFPGTRVHAENMSNQCAGMVKNADD